MLRRPRQRAFLGAGVSQGELCLRAATSDAQELETVKPVFTHAIPNIPGKSLTALQVNYPPGSRSPSRRHRSPLSSTAHVLTGAIRNQVDNERPAKVWSGWRGLLRCPALITE